jgi:hypothetical protein
MSKDEKILFVLLMGSFWGALELFGGDTFRACGISNKSAYLFGLGLIILYASKRVVDFAGSVVLMAAIACIFKTASTHFYACQIAAVMINGIIFDAGYTIYKSQLNASIIYRIIAAPLLAYISFAIFAIMATFVFKEAGWATNEWSGIREYLLTSALIASLFSIVTINAGYYLGNMLRSLFMSRKVSISSSIFRVTSLALVAIIWIAGQIY